MRDRRSQEGSNENDPAGKGLYYATANEFVTMYLLPNWTHRISRELKWCRQWWRHAEAIARLDALWRAFEAHRVSKDANAMAVWWRDFADPMMCSLTRTDGTFTACNAKAGEHKNPSSMLWPNDDPPQGIFPDERGIAAETFADYEL